MTQTLETWPSSTSWKEGRAEVKWPPLSRLKPSTSRSCSDLEAGQRVGKANGCTASSTPRPRITRSRVRAEGHLDALVRHRQTSPSMVHAERRPGSPEPSPGSRTGNTNERIHLTPSNPLYVKNALAWLYRQECYEGSKH